MKKLIARLTGLILTTALISVALIAPKAMAYKISVSASIVSTHCIANIPWQGEAKPAHGYWPGYVPTQPNGKLKICATMLKLKDKDKKANYYVAEVQMKVTYSKSHKKAVKKGANFFFGPAPFKVTITSTRSAAGHVYSATPSIKRTLGSVNVSAAFGLGPFSISTSSKLNLQTVVKRSKLSKKKAQWRSKDVSDVKRLSVMYAQKVSTKKTSKAPRMVIVVEVPQVHYIWTKHLAHAHGHAYYAYSPGSTILKSVPYILVV